MGHPLKNKENCFRSVTNLSSCLITSAEISSILKRTNGVIDNLKLNNKCAKSSSISTNHLLTNSRGINNTAGNPPHDSMIRSKGLASKKFIETDSKIKSSQLNYKEVSANHQDYKSRNTATNFSTKLQQSTLQRENHLSTTQQSQPPSRNDSGVYDITQKTLEQNTVPKIAPMNFPPLRAPQSIVNFRHPFVTEARTKHENSKSKDLDVGRQTYHGYGTSPITTISNMQNLGSITTNISPYPRPDPFPQPTVTNVLFPETAQFSQSPSFNTPQLNQFQTYDPGSFATTPMNVNSVIPQFSTESSIPYPQYENPQFVATNHYPTADVTNSQYQYSTSVSQIQDSPLFIQSLHSPIAVTDQYVAPNYARAVRTELIPRLRRPSRFAK